MNVVQTGWIAGAVAAGITAGIAFAFSNFIMRAFARLPEAEAIRAMQSINETVLNPLFLFIFMGTGVVMAGWMGVDYATATSFNPWSIAGVAIYLIGVCAVTVAGNVPLNDALAQSVASEAPAGSWMAYAQPWTLYNHIRTVSAAISAAAFAAAALP